jgi:hypothetical protein
MTRDDDQIVLPRQGDDRHQADIGVARLQRVSTLGRQSETKIENIPLLAMDQTPHQRDRVQVTNRTSAKFFLHKCNV